MVVIIANVLRGNATGRHIGYMRRPLPLVNLASPRAIAADSASLHTIVCPICLLRREATTVVRWAEGDKARGVWGRQAYADLSLPYFVIHPQKFRENTTLGTSMTR